MYIAGAFVYRMLVLYLLCRKYVHEQRTDCPCNQSLGFSCVSGERACGAHIFVNKIIE